MKKTAALALVLMLAGCKGVGLGQLDLEAAPPPPGLAPALDTQSPESKANDKWFKSYYGTGKSDEQKEKDWWGSYYGGQGAKGTNSLGW